MVQIIKDSIARYMGMRNDTVGSMFWGIRNGFVEAARASRDKKKDYDYNACIAKVNDCLDLAEKNSVKIETAYEIYKQVCEIERNNGEED